MLPILRKSRPFWQCKHSAKYTRRNSCDGRWKFVMYGGHWFPSRALLRMTGSAINFIRVLKLVRAVISEMARWTEALSFGTVPFFICPLVTFRRSSTSLGIRPAHLESRRLTLLISLFKMVFRLLLFVKNDSGLVRWTVIRPHVIS